MHKSLSVKATTSQGHLSNEGSVCSPNHIELLYIYISTSELGAPLYTRQPSLVLLVSAVEESAVQSIQGFY